MLRKFFVITTLFFIVSQISIAQNVGIDEPNPSEKLDVNGRIKAKGFKNTIYQVQPVFFANANAVWADMSGTSITFTLSEATTVTSSYTLSGYSPNNNPFFFIGTRILVDNVDVNKSGVAGARYNAMHYQDIQELSAGTHTIKVQYYVLGNGGNQFTTGTPIGINKLQVLVNGSN